MRAIINQKLDLPRLPELRNLGTVLRILLAVNGLALVAVFVRAPRLGALSGAWLDTAGIVEPQLLASCYRLLRDAGHADAAGHAARVLHRRRA